MGPNRGIRHRHQRMRPECDQGIQSQQRRCCAQYCQVRPLPLRFDAQMLSHFLERGLDPPAKYEATEDSQGVTIEIGTQERLGVTFPGWIADQDPADRGPEGIDVP